MVCIISTKSARAGRRPLVCVYADTGPSGREAARAADPGKPVACGIGAAAAGREPLVHSAYASRDASGRKPTSVFTAGAGSAAPGRGGPVIQSVAGP